MGEYADVKRKKIKKLLKWLDQQKYISIARGGNHQYNIKYNYWDRPYPIPFKHGTVNKHIVKALMKKLVDSDICTEEEFNKKIK